MRNDVLSRTAKAPQTSTNQRASRNASMLRARCRVVFAGDGNKVSPGNRNHHKPCASRLRAASVIRGRRAARAGGASSKTRGCAFGGCRHKHAEAAVRANAQRWSPRNGNPVRSGVSRIHGHVRDGMRRERQQKGRHQQVNVYNCRRVVEVYWEGRARRYHVRGGTNESHARQARREKKGRQAGGGNGARRYR